MKLKTITISIFIFLMSITLSSADKITLHNGNIVKGNVIEIYAGENPSILFDIVIDGQLANMQIIFYGTEIAIIEVSQTYRDLKRVPLTDEEREKDIEAYQKRQKGNSEINDRITSRIERQKDRRIEQRQREEDKVHEKEVINQRHYNRKDLISHSVNEYVTPKVIIKDTNETNRQEYYRDRE